MKVQRSNVFTKEWKEAHGDPLDDDNDEEGGHKFDQDDFECDAGNGFAYLKSYNGRIIAINKNVLKVID